MGLNYLHTPYLLTFVVYLEYLPNCSAFSRKKLKQQNIRPLFFEELCFFFAPLCNPFPLSDAEAKKANVKPNENQVFRPRKLYYSVFELSKKMPTHRDIEIRAQIRWSLETSLGQSMPSYVCHKN